MSELGTLLPVTAQDISIKLRDEPVLMTNSGDLLIYDGMLGPDGQNHLENGIPHMSREICRKRLPPRDSHVSTDNTQEPRR